MFWGRIKGPAHLHASAEIAKANCVPFGKERVSVHNMQNGLSHCRTCMLPIGMRRLLHMERNTPDLWIAISSTNVPTKYGLTARTNTTISSTSTMLEGCFAAARPLATLRAEKGSEPQCCDSSPAHISRHYEFPRFQKTRIPFACWSVEGRRGDIVMMQAGYLDSKLICKGGGRALM